MNYHRSLLFSLLLLPSFLLATPTSLIPSPHSFLLGSLWWSRASFNFGMEKVSLHFPSKPTISHDQFMKHATSYDTTGRYTFSGYFPPIGNINAYQFFNEKIAEVSVRPFELIHQNRYQNTAGDWCLEYSARDHLRKCSLHTFIVVTPFNGYILQCVTPHFGFAHQFEHFRDHFFITCECQ